MQQFVVPENPLIFTILGMEMYELKRNTTESSVAKAKFETNYSQSKDVGYIIRHWIR